MAEITNPMKAIRAKCIDCMCGQINEIPLCPGTDCPLWPFRMGKNPYRKPRQYSEEQLTRLRESAMEMAAKRKEKNASED